MKSLQLDLPYMILMVGIPGSGKSYFARQFAELFNIPLVNGDIVSHNLITTYLLPELFKTERTVIVDSDTLTKKSRDEMYSIAKKSGYKVLTVWIQTDNETAKSRTQKINKITGRNKDFDSELSKFTSPGISENSLVLSGKHTFATQTKIVLSRLIQTRAALSTSSLSKPRG